MFSSASAGSWKIEKTPHGIHLCAAFFREKSCERSEIVVELLIVKLFIVKLFVEIFIVESVVAELAAVEDIVIIVEIIEEIITFVEVVEIVRVIPFQKRGCRADYGTAFRTAAVFRLNGTFAHFDIAIRTNRSHFSFSLL